VPSALALANGGGVFGSTVSLTPKRITVGLLVRPASIVTRETVLDALLLSLAGVLPISTDAAPDRIGYGILAGTPVVTPCHNAFGVPEFDIVLTFDFPDPIRYARSPYTRGLTTARVSCPVGTLPSLCRIWMYGNATPVVNPSIILRRQTGEIVSTLLLTGSLGSNTALDIGRTPQRIEHYSAGVLSTGTAAGLTWYTSGAFPVLSPDDGTPTIELSSTSGTPTGLLLSRESW
jgi:hypothetical protein